MQVAGLQNPRLSSNNFCSQLLFGPNELFHFCELIIEIKTLRIGKSAAWLDDVT